MVERDVPQLACEIRSDPRLFIFIFLRRSLGSRQTSPPANYFGRLGAWGSFTSSPCFHFLCPPCNEMWPFSGAMVVSGSDNRRELVVAFRPFVVREVGRVWQ